MGKYYKDILINNKDSLIVSIFQFTAVILLLIKLHLHTWYEAAGVIAITTTTISLLFKIINKENIIFKQQLKQLISSFIIISIIFIIIFYLKGYGIIGTIIIVLLLSGYKMYKAKEFLGRSKAEIEIMIFGQPQTQKWRDELGYKGTFKEYWKKKKK